jgi:hypothetical protein
MAGNYEFDGMKIAERWWFESWFVSGFI